MVSRRDTVCSVKGAVTGNLDLSRYTDLFSGCTAVSLADVSFVSWVGLDRFLQFLVKHGAPTGVVVTDVAWSVVLPFACLHEGRKALGLGSVELAAFDKSTGGYVRKPVELDAFLSSLAEPSPGGGAPAGTERGEWADGRLRVLTAPEIVFKDFIEARGLKVADDARERAESAEHFELLLAAFMKGVIGLCKVHVESIAVSALNAVQDLLLRLDSGAAVLKKTPAGEGCPTFDKASLVDSLAVMHQTLIEGLVDIDERLNSAFLHFHAGARKLPPVDASGDVVKTLTDATTVMNEFTAKADGFGAEVLGVVMGLSVGGALKAAVLSLEGKPEASDASFLQELADAFFVVDAFAAEEWTTLKPELEKECDGIDTQVMNLIVELQGFDAVRQVVEKRSKEISLWIDFLAGGMDLADPSVRSSILDAIGGKLVTEQERKAFALFFSHLVSFDSSSVDTGEVSFF